MNKQFILSEWEKTAIYCPTKQESEEVNELIVQFGGRNLHCDWGMYESQTCYTLDFPYNCYSPYTFYVEEKYKIITAQEFINTFKTQNMKKPAPFTITGNPYLLEAISKELIDMGYTFKVSDFKTCIQNDTYTHAIKELKDFTILTSASTASDQNPNQFSLPAQYQQALDYCKSALDTKNWVAEFKEGDIVVIQNNAQCGHSIGTIGKAVRVHTYSAEIDSHLSSTGITMAHDFENLRHATAQEIETFNKPVYKIGDYVTFLPEKCVGEWSHCLTSTWNSKKTYKIDSISNSNITVNNGAASNAIEVFRPATKEEIEQFNKPTTKTLVLGTSRISIVIGKGSIMADGNIFDYGRLIQLANQMEGSGNTNLGNYLVSFATVRIGCSDFSKEQIIKICNTYEEINGLSLTNYHPF